MRRARPTTASTCDSAATTSTVPIAATSSPAISRARSTATACASAASWASRAATPSPTTSRARCPATRWEGPWTWANTWPASGRRGGAPGGGAEPMKTSRLLGLLGLALAVSVSAAEPKYDLLLKGGHVIDAKNGISAVRDVAIAGGKVAAVAAKIDPAEAFKVVDVSGLYVTPGLIDLHVHVFAGTGEKNSYAGDNSLYPDGYTLRVGVTTVADAGCAGWRNFEEFKTRVIDRSKTRVLAFLNIVGNGMRGGKFEQDLSDMEAKPTADMARRFPGVVVGVKTAH